MDKSICKVCSGQRQDNKWLPCSIQQYREEILARYTGEAIDNTHKLHPVFSNIAYNMQYLEFLNKCFEDLYLTSVLRAQNVKMFLLTSSQIIECLLNVKLIELGADKNDIWDFGYSLREAQRRNVFGLGHAFYANEMKWMKNLRNHVHIQSAEDIGEADYAVFEKLEVLNDTKAVLVYFLQRALKMSGEEIKTKFYFLQPTKAFIHSIDHSD